MTSAGIEPATIVAQHFKHCATAVPPPIPPYTSWKSILILSSYLCLGLPSGLFPSGFPTKTLYTPLLSPTGVTCSAHHDITDTPVRFLDVQSLSNMLAAPSLCYQHTRLSLPVNFAKTHTLRPQEIGLLRDTNFPMALTMQETHASPTRNRTTSRHEFPNAVDTVRQLIPITVPPDLILLHAIRNKNPTSSPQIQRLINPLALELEFTV